GGVVFGPKPRDYSKKVNKTVKRLAFRKALSERIRTGDVLIVDNFAIKDGKTKQFIAALKAITEEPKTLVVSMTFDELTQRAARNVPGSLLATAANVNTEQLLLYRKIVITPDALAHFAERITK